MTLDEYFAGPDAKTRSELAEEVGISESTLSRICRGKQNTTRDVILKLIEATGHQVTAAGVLGIDESDAPPPETEGVPPFPPATTARAPSEATGQPRHPEPHAATLPASSPTSSPTSDRLAASITCPTCSTGPSVQPRTSFNDGDDAIEDAA